MAKGSSIFGPSNARNILAAERLIYTTAEEERLAAIKLSLARKGVVIPLGGDAPYEKLR